MRNVSVFEYLCRRERVKCSRMPILKNLRKSCLFGGFRGEIFSVKIVGVSQNPKDAKTTKKLPLMMIPVTGGPTGPIVFFFNEEEY